jgi:hypothetical protein
VAVRTRNGKDLGTMPLDDVRERLRIESTAAAALFWRIDL